MNASLNNVSDVYAGFMRRLSAIVLDVVLLVAVATLIFCLIYGSAYFDAEEVQVNKLLALFVNDAIPFLLTVFFWVKYKGSPGKLLLSCNVVDAKTGKRISVGKAVLRYLSYFISALPLGLGFLWIIWDPKKQGFHDKIAGTIVIMEDENSKSLLDLAYEL